MECIECGRVEDSQGAIATHLLTEHRIVISSIGKIADLSRYAPR